MILDDYLLNLPKIGEGSYGEVYLTSKRNSKEIFATKKVEKQKIMSEKLREYFLNEIEILKNLNHPNIMKLVEIKSSHNNIYLITEYCNGGTLSENLTMYQKLHKSPLPEVIVIHFMKQIADAINYLHDRRIIHRDLKMENILLHFENLEDRKKLNFLQARVKIIDFGFARYLSNNSVSASIVGSPLNMAPDILHALTDISWRKNLRYNEKADIYSIGVIMFILLIGKPPFNARDYKDLFTQVNYGIYSIPKDLKLSKECITLMNGMMMQDSDKRFSILEVLRSDFLSKPYESFEFVDFSEFENAKNVNYGVKQNENMICLDIKQMINLDNKKQPQQLNENLNANKDDLNVILNDMNKKDQELEELLEQLQGNKIEDINAHNFKNINDANERNFLAQAQQEEKSNAMHKRSESNLPSTKNSKENLADLNKAKTADYKTAEAKPTKDLEFAKPQQKEKSDDFKYPELDANVKKPSNANANNNLIDLNNYENIKSYFTSETTGKTAKKNSDMNLAHVYRHDAGPKGIFDIPMEKLDGIFEMINNKFEKFEMEAVPIYLENPHQYENYIL